MSAKYPNISVIILAYNSERAVSKTIKSVLSQKYDGEIDAFSKIRGDEEWCINSIIKKT